MRVYTLKQTPLTLKEPALSSGGEGAVYEIEGFPNRVVKIYHEAKDARKREEKIRAMVEIAGETQFKAANIAENIAWPLSPVLDAGGNVIGFGMNRIKADKELDDLYAYPPKNDTFSIKEKLKILINLCDVIERLHLIRQIFGDFNPNNIKVKADGTVNFVDADSYHIKKRGKEYKCVVCAPGYVAPELIKKCRGTTYEACTQETFTVNTDRFALAIHIFRMLMQGVHPFMCERQIIKGGSLPAPKSTDKRVENGETPFFKNIPNYSVPTYAPNLNAFPPYLRELFKKAFVDGYTNPDARPSATEWKVQLMRFQKELVKCNHGNKAHYYWKGYHTCPYCEADARYNQKMKQLLPTKAGNNSTNTYTAPKVATPTPKVTTGTAKHSSVPIRRNSSFFWLITMVGMVALQVLLALYVLPEAYWELFGNDTWATIGVVGSVLTGCGGTIWYNTRTCRTYAWYEYIFSLLISVGFAAGFAIALAIAYALLYILAYLFFGIFIIGAVIGALTGG